MKVLIALVALCAIASAAPVAPVLLPKVQVAPAQVTVVKQPYVFSEPEPVYRTVPVPVKAVSYTAPAVVPGPVIAPAPVAYAAPAVAYAAPAVAYAAPAVGYASPYGVAPAHYIH
ncbi:cuticle protein 16.5-like [Macrosteles quadrilineatus]|uniref:cuticle protein 16.5-like n=1 Tax=Macrosteles quadrilineatus TaxID=74068 RepID=UPI0023E31EED|nr:cuticle protein 16.5-like [Macrosteles quadrilineatus]